MNATVAIAGSSHRTRAARPPLQTIYSLEPVLAAVALSLLAPLGLVVAIVIAVLSRRSPLVRHARVGWKGQPLRVLKFRTMWDPNRAPSALLAIEDVADYIPAAKHGRDPRVCSRFAAWCRRFSVDELPQLFHIVRGEMSFVGPRPITRTELEMHYGWSAREVLSLRPGLTGLWQIMGRDRLTHEMKRRFDVLLVRRASARLYAAILLRSIPAVLSGKDAH